MYYISSGEQSKMYTLRTNYQMEIPLDNGGSVLVTRDYYIRNLSIDKDKAFRVANEMGYDVKEKPNFDLDEIRRNKSEEVARKIAEREAEERAEAELEENRKIAMISNFTFPFGRYKGMNFASVPESYVQYWLSITPTEDDNVLNALISVLGGLFPKIVDRIKRSTGNGEYFGTIKTRYQNLKGEIIDTFAFDTFYGRMNGYKIVLDSGELCVYIGSAYLTYYIKETNEDVFASVGDTITLAATVKDHTVYQEVKQTKLARPTLKQLNKVKVKNREKV